MYRQLSLLIILQVDNNAKRRRKKKEEETSGDLESIQLFSLSDYSVVRL